MKIDRLDLIAYGPFTGRSLDLSAGDPGLHVIFGHNEAGKSSALRALTAWLFGFPYSTDDDHLHDYSQLRVGGEIALADGGSYAFVRRKGRKGTILDPADEAPMDGAPLKRCLRGLDEALFAKLYGIDHERLVKGGRDILDQSGDVGRVLFSAALGTADLRSLIARMESEAAELFLPRGRKQVVPQALSAYKEARDTARGAELSVDAWEDLQADIQQTREAIEALDEDVRRVGQDKSRLGRVKRVLGAVAEYRDVLQQLEDVGDHVLLPESFTQRRLEALEGLRAAKRRQASARLSLERRQADLAELTVESGFVEHQEIIGALYKKLGAVEQAIADRPMQDGKRRVLRNKARKLLESVHPKLDIDEAESLRGELANEELIGELSEKYAVIQKELESLNNERRKHENDLAVLANTLQNGPAPRRVASLKASVTEARRSGELEARLDRVAEDVAQKAARCEGTLARLGRFGGSLDELCRLPTPVEATVDLHDKRLGALEDAHEALVQRRRELTQRRQKEAEALGALLRARQVPTLAELTEARQARDALWGRVRLAATGAEGAPDDPDALCEAFSRSLAEADRLADLLREAAADVERRASLEAALEGINHQLDQLDRQEREAAEALEVARVAWVEVWEPCDLEPGTPAEMKQWLMRTDTLVNQAETLDADRRERAILQAEIKRHKEALADELGDVGIEVEPEGLGLEELLQRCETLIDVSERNADEHRRARHAHSEKELALAKTLEAIEDKEARLTSWREQWGQTISPLGLPPSTPPTSAKVVFKKLVAFFEAYDEADGLRRRIYGIDRRTRLFDEQLDHFLDLIGLERGELTATDMVERLKQRLDDAIVAQTSKVRLNEQIKEHEEEIARAQLDIDANLGELAALRERAGVDTNEALEAAEARSRSHQQLLSRREDLERELIRSGDGVSLERLLAEVDAVDPDTLEEELLEVDHALTQKVAERDELRLELHTLKERMEALDGSDLAARATEEAEQQLAVAVSGVKDYLRLKIASSILHAQIEAYRQTNQAPVLRRASQLFSTLTLGSFAGLRDELDSSGRPILLGVRDGGQEVKVSGMSDGTRDQLFLSLRLATLEQHLGEQHEPIPFVVDDILVTFDDPRTRASLEVLAELATQTQVLLFTHHHRVVEIARTVEIGQVTTHSLEGDAQP